MERRCVWNSKIRPRSNKHCASRYCVSCGFCRLFHKDIYRLVEIRSFIHIICLKWQNRLNAKPLANLITSTVMIATITTYFDCSEGELWEKIKEPWSLQYVAAPILSFRPHNDVTLTGDWEVNKPYPLKLHLFSIIPLGKHTIKLVKLDKESKTIQSQEKGLLAPVWNHDIQFSEIEPGKVRYTDRIEIKAGLLTPIIWLFAHFFYRHRQRRWRVLLGNKV